MVGEELNCMRETTKSEDPYAVAVMRNTAVVDLVVTCSELLDTCMQIENYARECYKLNHAVLSAKLHLADVL